MRFENLILPELFHNSINSTGVLDTTEKVLQASEELIRDTAEAFEVFRISKLRSYEKAMYYFLD
jgi:hypothetical protein